MKTTLMIFLITITTSALATMEHREGYEAKPLAQKLSNSRECFNEIKNLGCQHPREGQEIFNSCLDDQFSKLTSSCQSFFGRLYGKR